MSQSQNFGAEGEKWITEQGYGGTTTKASIARDLLGRAQTGFTAASVNNPNLTPRDYFATLGPKFMQNQLAGMTSQQKGESYGNFAPRSRWTP
jgi:hypothetical protein